MNMPEPKLMITLITGGLATAAAFRRDLDALFAGHRSLVSQMKSEQERIHEIDAFLGELSGDKEKRDAARQAFERDRRVALERLKRLTVEFARQREDPNCDLSFMQRVFLLFRPESARAEMAHLGAWAFVAIGLIAIFVGIFLSSRNDLDPDFKEGLADLALLGCFGFLVLRGWALAERRATYGYDGNGSRIKAIFMVKRPANVAMIGAQACFWACAYWVLESVEDLFYDAAPHLTGPNQVPWTHAETMEALLKFTAPLLAALFCRQWASQEWKSCGRELQRWSPAILFRAGWRTLAVIVSIAMVGAAALILALQPKFFHEQEHQIALLLQALISCLACSQWLALASQMNVVKMEEPARAQSAAA